MSITNAVTKIIVAAAGIVLIQEYGEYKHQQGYIEARDFWKRVREEDKKIMLAILKKRKEEEES